MTGRAIRYWLVLLWASVALLPMLRLPGGIPLRPDDILVFGGAVLLLGLLVSRDLLPRLLAADWVLLATALFILVVTLRGTPVLGATVGPRELLDTIRPLKFLALLLILDRLDYPAFRSTMERVLPITLYMVVLFALAQLLLLQPGSGGPLAQLSLLFSELEEWHVRSMFGNRPFGTFHTPTDLGYFASITLLVSLLLKNFPNRWYLLAASVVGVVISGTRTFLFFLPLLLLLYSLATGGDVIARMKRFTGALVLVAVGAAGVVVLLPSFTIYIVLTLVSLVTGDLASDQSIVERLENLQLVELTLRTAPFTGVVTRDLMTRGMDSEYLLTLHRYGLVGLGLTLALYVAIVAGIWRRRRLNPDLTWLTLLVVMLTFVYGLTQGALISTRVGVMFFVILGMERSYARYARQGPQATNGSELANPRPDPPDELESGPSGDGRPAMQGVDR